MYTVEEIIAEVEATMAMEGISVTEETKQVIRDCLTGKKTFDDARKEAIEMAKKKTEAWEYALGLNKVDGLNPSKEFLELVEKEIQGKITTKDIRNALDEKYRKQR